MNQLIITLSGKKRSGKNTLSNFIAGSFLKATHQVEKFSVTAKGLLKYDKCTLTEGTFNEVGFKDVKLYAFSDALKRFCIDILGLTYEQCYGDDEDRDSIVNHIEWDTLPLSIRKDYDEVKTFPNGREGNMTAREVLQIFGTEMVRSMYHDAWAEGTYKIIKREGFKLAIITDGRFPNEINIGKEFDAKSVRLLRDVSKGDEHLSEIALDGYKDFSYVLDNRDMTVKAQNEAFQPILKDWLFQKFYLPIT
jgi:hypothetical protein